MALIERNTNEQSTRVRVLVVENDPRQRADIVENLRTRDYEIYVAGGQRDTSDSYRDLLSDAIWKAHNHRCHIALVDMRLNNDTDAAESTGLLLIPKLAPTISIVLSGYGDRNTVRRALKSPPDPPQRAYDFIGKEDGPGQLLAVIEDAARNACALRPVAFNWSPDLGSGALIKQFFPADASVPHDEVDEVLRRLFPLAQCLKIEVIGGDSHGVSTPPQQRSVVLKVTADDHARPVIVKLARVQRMTEEVKRFAQVAPYFPATRFSRLQDTVELWDLGGAVYEFLGGDGAHPLQLFTEYYAAHQVEDIRQVLGRLVEFWKPLYDLQMRPSEERKTLFRAYCDVWGGDWCERLLRSRQDFQFPPQFSGLDLPEPAAWLLQRMQLDGDGEYHAVTPNTDLAIVHGDLHGDNVFVDTRHDVWVIDFERTGPGPILQDFVELETDILTRLVHLDSDPACLYNLVLALLKPLDPLQRLESATLILNNAKARKAFSVIARLRDLAYQVIGSYDQRLYLWGLLLNTMYRISLWQAEGGSAHNDTVRQRRMFFLSGMLCHRLDNWSCEWPPAEWPRLDWASYVEHEKRVTLVEELYEQFHYLKTEIARSSNVSSAARQNIEDIVQQLRDRGEQVEYDG